ncbi:MAG: hypothetical protein ABIL44_02860 [candidate division WOR-3 bacterium]
MIFFLINSIPFLLGLKIDYCTIGHFNKHFQFLENRASMLGWNGDLGRFDNILYSPTLELEFMKIENLSTCLSIYYFRDKNTGKFSYPAGTDTFWLNEEWRYWRIPFDIKFNLYLGPIIFISGFEVSFTKLTIDALSNYQMNEKYPKYFESNDVGLFIGLGKKIKKFQFEIFYTYTRNDQFYNEDGFLYYNEIMGYIYIGPDNHNNPTAILDHSGIGIILYYNLFD